MDSGVERAQSISEVYSPKAQVAPNQCSPEINQDNTPKNTRLQTPQASPYQTQIGHQKGHQSEHRLSKNQQQDSKSGSGVHTQIPANITSQDLTKEQKQHQVKEEPEGETVISIPKAQKKEKTNISLRKEPRTKTSYPGEAIQTRGQPQRKERPKESASKQTRTKATKPTIQRPSHKKRLPKRYRNSLIYITILQLNSNSNKHNISPSHNTACYKLYQSNQLKTTVDGL